MQPKWCRRRVIEVLQERHRAGLPLTNLRQSGAAPLYYAAGRYFGSVGAACRAAGIPDPWAPVTWDRETVVAELRRLQHDGATVTASGNKRLAAAARQVFGSWRAALQAAGLPCGPAPRSWNRERVLKEILRRHDQGLSLLPRDNGALVRAAQKHAGGWSKALTAIGLEPQRRRSTRDDVLREIRSYYERGELLTYRTNPRLTQMARRSFGKFHDAIKAAGFTPSWRARPAGIRWSKQRIIDDIQDYWRRYETLERISVMRPLLCSAGRRYFGRWKHAVQAAGFELKCREKWTKQRVVAELRACHGTVKENHSRLNGAIRTWFGNLDQARMAAGVPPPSRWSRQRVIELLQDQYTRGVPMTTKRANCSLVWAARKYFGGWAAASPRHQVHTAGMADAD